MATGSSPTSPSRSSRSIIRTEPPTHPENKYRVRRGPLKTKDRPHVCSPRRRKPSPTGKVDRAQPGPDEGIQPKSEKQATLNGSISHSMWPVSLLGCGPSSVRAFGPATFPVGEGCLPVGVPYLPLGEGAAAAAEEGRYRVGSGFRPTPVRASLCHPLPGEGFSLIRHAIRRATFPVGEGCLPAGVFLTFPLAFQTFFRLPPLRIPYCVVK